jgi:hypothetical protein
VEEVSKLLAQSPVTNCKLDPIPTTLLQCASRLNPTITKIINLSFFSGVFPQQLKTFFVHPVVKKSNLYKEISVTVDLSHIYLFFLSSLRELYTCHTHRLSSHNLLNPFQSAYIKFHSTESDLLSLHDHIIKAMGQQQITCLCLLDLSAAFDAINHSILLEHLTSWFGLDRTVLAPVLWNRLPTDLRAHSQCLAGNSLASPVPCALSPSQLHAKLRSYLFHYSFPP